MEYFLIKISNRAKESIFTTLVQSNAIREENKRHINPKDEMKLSLFVNVEKPKESTK